MSSQSAAFAFEGAPSREAARAFLERALARHEAAQNLIVTVPAPVAPPDALLRAFPKQASLLWDPPQSPACSGLGVATTLAPTAEALGRFFAHAEHVADLASPAPRVFGGVSFASGSAAHVPWERFGDGFLLLPTWTYHVDDRAWLSLAVCGLDQTDMRALLGAFDTVWGSLERPLGVIPSSVSARRIDEADRDTWRAHVEDIRERIRQGELEKVVAARHCVVELETGASSLDVLKRLEQRFPGCTRFALWRGNATFLGATPELLIAKKDHQVLSEALAGSTSHGEGARMLSSAKEREEHQLVVQAILEGLAPFCDTLRSDPEPSVRELPNLLHMQTAIEGTLAGPHHVLSLVHALHPTPAVGGVPTDKAVEWIVDREALARGWYSAPVGWADSKGDGEFVVALRSGVLRDRNAWVYAGAGIMADSDPDAEYTETELKMQALLGALHGDNR